MRRNACESVAITLDHEPPTTNHQPILERETGIEPATNSLEGCDSTTELLPPIPIRNAPDPPLLVAREGLEPSKPLGRQIYSLLRLTASLPRQLSVCVGTR